MSIDHIAGGRNTARQTLTDTCTITRPVAGEWTPDGGLPDDTTTIWSGPCSLSDPASTRGVRTDYATADRAILAQVLRVPLDTDTPAGPIGVQGGDLVTIASRPGETFTVSSERARTNRVLQRIYLVAVEPTPGVPR